MKPTEVLADEHEYIVKVIDSIEKEIKDIFDGAEFDALKFEKAIDFITNFADGIHHAKEEKLLFNKLEEKGMSKTSGPVFVMLSEHDQGRRFINSAMQSMPLAKQNDKSAIYLVASNLNSYAALLRQHIFKENNILFPMADRIMNDNDQLDLEQKFTNEDASLDENGRIQYYKNIASELYNKTI